MDYVFALSIDKYSYFITQKRSEMHSTKMCKCKIRNNIIRKVNTVNNIYKLKEVH